MPIPMPNSSFTAEWYREALRRSVLIVIVLHLPWKQSLEVQSSLLELSLLKDRKATSMKYVSLYLSFPLCLFNS